MKLTLLHKVLLLVSVPLCFEITIFGVLINLQNQAEVEAQKVDRNKRINDCVNHILIYGISLGRVRHNYNLEAFKAAKFKEDKFELTRNFDLLEKLTRYDRSLNQDVLECRRSLFIAFDDLSYVKKKLETVPPEQLPLLIAESRHDLDVDIDNAKKAGLQELAEKSLKGTDETRGRILRERAQSLLKYALALSVLTGIFGAIMFSKHLASRLRRLSANAGRLAQGQALHPVEGGTDELAQLDTSFHYAASLIARAAKMRQEVAAMITHDLKTPLLAISQFLTGLETERLGKLNAQGVELFKLSEAESRRMLSLIDSVLELERLRIGSEKLNLANINVIHFLNQSIDAVKILADEKQIDIKKDFTVLSDDTINGDAFWLEQVMVNILSNAIKFSPAGTSVTVSTQRLARELCVSITDQGPGIPELDLQHIFDRFHRVSSTSANIAGSGLGLTISKELVELHSGSIVVTSTVGKGSTFTVKLPRTGVGVGVGVSAGVGTGKGAGIGSGMSDSAGPSRGAVTSATNNSSKPANGSPSATISGDTK